MDASTCSSPRAQWQLPIDVLDGLNSNLWTCWTSLQQLAGMRCAVRSRALPLTTVHTVWRGVRGDDGSREGLYGLLSPKNDIACLKGNTADVVVELAMPAVANTVGAWLSSALLNLTPQGAGSERTTCKTCKISWGQQQMVPSLWVMAISFGLSRVDATTPAAARSHAAWAAGPCGANIRYLEKCWSSCNSCLPCCTIIV